MDKNVEEGHFSTLVDPEKRLGFQVGDRFVNAWGRDFDPDDDIVDDEEDDSYATWTPEQLKAEAKARGVKPEGRKKSDFVAALEAYDVEHADDEEDEDAED